METPAGTMIEKAQAVLLAAVPAGKSIIWIIGVLVTSFLAGVGWTRSTVSYASIPEEIAQLARDVGASETMIRSNLQAISTIILQIEEGRRERSQILCLVTLTATGEVLSPLQVKDRCG